jgi:hypothetical protein
MTPGHPLKDPILADLQRKHHHLHVQEGAKRYGLSYNLVNRAQAAQKSIAKPRSAPNYDSFMEGRNRPIEEVARMIAMERSSGPKPPILERLAYRIFG